MTYIQRISLFDMDEDMVRKTPEQAEQFAREASALAIPKLQPIIPPEGLTRSQANEFVATMEVFRRPDVKLRPQRFENSAPKIKRTGSLLQRL